MLICKENTFSEIQNGTNLLLRTEPWERNSVSKAAANERDHKSTWKKTALWVTQGGDKRVLTCLMGIFISLKTQDSILAVNLMRY